MEMEKLSKGVKDRVSWRVEKVTEMPFLGSKQTIQPIPQHSSTSRLNSPGRATEPWARD